MEEREREEAAGGSRKNVPICGHKAFISEPQGDTMRPSYIARNHRGQAPKADVSRVYVVRARTGYYRQNEPRRRSRDRSAVYCFIMCAE